MPAAEMSLMLLLLLLAPPTSGRRRSDVPLSDDSEHLNTASYLWTLSDDIAQFEKLRHTLSRTRELLLLPAQPEDADSHRRQLKVYFNKSLSDIVKEEGRIEALEKDLKIVEDELARGGQLSATTTADLSAMLANANHYLLTIHQRLSGSVANRSSDSVHSHLTAPSKYHFVLPYPSDREASSGSGSKHDIARRVPGALILDAVHRHKGQIDSDQMEVARAGRQRDPPRPSSSLGTTADDPYLLATLSVLVAIVLLIWLALLVKCCQNYLSLRHGGHVPLSHDDPFLESQGCEDKHAGYLEDDNALFGQGHFFQWPTAHQPLTEPSVVRYSGLTGRCDISVTALSRL